MALIYCPECGREISDKAAACPHCGYPMKEELSPVGGSPVSGGLSARQRERVLEYLRQGDHIRAVKHYREITSLGLKESYDAVKALARQHNIEIQKSKGCFIATACYGSENHYKVGLFKLYRDQVLLNKKTGRLAVRMYYLISPLAASLIRPSEFLQGKIVRLLLDPILKRLFK